MLEQWHADQLIALPKIYTYGDEIDLTPGANDFYSLESASGHEFFFFDVWRSRLNPLKVRFQLRYQRQIILVRLCQTAPHTNPDDEFVESPHLHRYREGFEDKWAESISNSTSINESLEVFCGRVNLPPPSVLGGIT